MKKAYRICLVFVLVLALSLPAFASGLREEGKDVPATYVAGTNTDTGTIYAVDLSWGTITALKYTGTSTTYRWNASSHQYEVDSSSGNTWTDSSISITVTNHSNADIKATAAYTDKNDDALTTAAEWTTQSVTCTTADAGIVDYVGTGAATNGTISGTVKVTAGTISADTTSVGTITIRIESV